MKKNALNEIIKNGQKAIETQLLDLNKQLQSLKLSAARGEVKNTRSAKIIRRSVARLKTALSLIATTKEQS